MQKIIFTLIALFIFTGCSIKESTNGDSYKFTYIHSTGVTNFQQLTKNLLRDLCPTLLDIKEHKTRIQPLYVTDFVNIKDLDNKSQLGFLLSDELKTNITQECNWPVSQIEYSKYLKIGKSGVKVLTRDVEELKTKKLNMNTYILVGTYAITQRQLIVYLKLINLKDGVILKAATKRVTLTDEIIDLEGKSNSFDPNSIYQPMTL